MIDDTLRYAGFGGLRACWDDAAAAQPVAAPLTALATLVIVAGLTLRFSAALRLWAPVIGIVAGCIVAAAMGHL